jgi:hypothetical protein
MVLELLRLLGGTLVLMIPGILLAGGLGLGRDRLERWTHGGCLGLALAVYIASAISQFNLHGFYPAWAIITAIAVARFRRRGIGEIDRGMILVLLIVAATRYAIALPQILPKGWDPTFHMILARKIQITQHAIWDWSPFESARLNYPTGSHVLVVVISAISGLPLQTVFKDFIPLLGVLTTAQIYIFARRVTGDAAAALYAALAYGVWANFGSVGYYDWGGLPNELAMLFLLAMLSAWLEDWRRSTRMAVMAVLYAATILTHHHVMIVSGVVLVAILAFTMAGPTGRLLAMAAAAGALLDAFFLVPYAAKVATLASTNVLHRGEAPLDLLTVWRLMGYVYVAAAVVGIALWRRGPMLITVCVAMIGMYLACEYVWPTWLAIHGQPPSTAFTPSRLPSDLNYFLAVFVGVALAFAQRKLRVAKGVMIMLILLAATSEIGFWRTMAGGSGVSPDFVAACDWIQKNTPADCVVLSRENWTTYLTWRKTFHTPMPDSEPLEEIRPRVVTPGTLVVAIIGAARKPQWPVLWRGGDWLVVRVSP